MLTVTHRFRLMDRANVIAAFRQLTGPHFDGDDVLEFRLGLPAAVDPDGSPAAFLGIESYLIRGPHGTIEVVAAKLGAFAAALPFEGR